MVRPALGILFVGAIAVYSLAQSLVAFSRSNFVATVVAGGFVVFAVGFILGIAVSKLRSGRRVGAVDRAGTTFRPDPLVPWFLGCSFVGGAISSGLSLLFGGSHNLGLPFSAPGRASESIYMSALLVLSVIGVYAVVVRGRGYFRLTPAGIENADILHTRGAAWEDVAAIDDTVPRKPIHHPISFVVRGEEKPIVVGNASGYASSGVPLYWMVRHYWLHPENRGELADGRALDRLRAEDFVPE